LVIANRILFFVSIFLISSSLVLSPILSSPVFYSQKGPSFTFAQTDQAEDQASISFPVVPNVAFAQADQAEDQPSASFPLTVEVSTSCPGLPPIPAGTNQADTIYATDNGETINDFQQNNQ